MQIDVEIVQDGKFLGIAKSRPVRRLPTAVAGAVLRAKVYPVYRENDGRYTINLRDESHHPAECPFWRGSAPNFHPPSSLELPAEWYVETNTFGHYLLFDGSESVVEAVLARLDAHDLTVRRHGRSHRPADNGTRYDWFVRFADEGERGEMLVRLRRALEPQGQAEAEAESAVLKLWLRLRFHDDCIDTIVLRFSDPSTLFKLLSDLNAGAGLARKKLSNVEGWFEVDKHIATGRCRRGRLYVRPTNDRCDVQGRGLISV